ncbi:MAG: type VI secretion system tip protein VgrG, partial [Desulfobacteraceae bacterium]|nr:type VI secretion system tip protein VgrG [Desulfobacteraceae bacterium]
MLPLSANASKFTFSTRDKAFSVVSFSANESISNLYEVKLDLVSQIKVPAADIIGKPALFTIKSEEGNRHFHGIIYEVIEKCPIGRFYNFEVTLSHPAVLLKHRQDCRIFQDLTVPEIVAQVMKNGGISADLFEFRTVNKYPKREYCVQYRETDWRFIKRLLAEEGIFFFFEHHPSKLIMVFGDSTVNYMPICGNAKILWNPGGSLVAEQEAIIGFEYGKQVSPDTFAHTDFDFKQPAMNLFSRHQAQQSTGLDLYDYPGNYTCSKEGARLSKVRLEQAVMNSRQAQGKSVVARFVPGFTFSIEDSNNQACNGAYLLTRIRHEGKQPQVLAENSSGSEGTSYINEFSAAPEEVTIRPEASDLEKPCVRGTQTAIVTGPEGEEIHTDEYGRIKVQFHWDRYGEYDDKSSCWIRVNQASAGQGWGAIQLPRIGQEVIVSFFNGDPDQPVITGGFYNGANVPPYSLPEQNSVATIKSLSSPGADGFNELRIQDRKGFEQFFFHAQRDMDLRVKNDRRT